MMRLEMESVSDPVWDYYEPSKGTPLEEFTTFVESAKPAYVFKTFGWYDPTPLSGISKP